MAEKQKQIADEQKALVAKLLAENLELKADKHQALLTKKDEPTQKIKEAQLVLDDLEAAKKAKEDAKKAATVSAADLAANKAAVAAR